ncbi:MAG: hypothetical protein Q8M93_02465 [Polaromonas sp.]|uniref:hypothetical protein n=1 Tax=Polaromonas sp. TaxID=1869339 RepID=UPI0027301A49|nr:hypothetical protein [Polaromonas sp.]MDP2448613.1 hypothetical protein [Polaromonas sp.]MDP3245811.1 hypothetical protein [Polaromonas sp.]MDP3757376.1 hypothetical protein [Polaromonas sp.]
MLIGLIILALVVVGLMVAFAAVAIFWIVMAVFWVSAIVMGLLVQDPYLGFFLAFPVTGLIFWLIGLNSEKSAGSGAP